MQPENTDLYMALGNFYFSRNKRDKTETSYLKAIESNPKNRNLYMVIAGFYDVTGNKYISLSMYKKALVLQPEDIRIMDSIARFYVKNKNIEDAEKYISKILLQKPQYYSTRMLKGELLIYQRKFAEAIELFAQQIKEEPRSAKAYYFNGIAHLETGDTKIAKKAAVKAVE